MKTKPGVCGFCGAGHDAVYEFPDPREYEHPAVWLLCCDCAFICLSRLLESKQINERQIIESLPHDLPELQ